jgi:hypothetical protein
MGEEGLKETGPACDKHSGRSERSPQPPWRSPSGPGLRWVPTTDTLQQSSTTTPRLHLAVIATIDSDGGFSHARVKLDKLVT